jgi:hypothetical protein
MNRLLDSSHSLSPRPSPPGRGRIVHLLGLNPESVVARLPEERVEASDRCSGSLGERVRVRVRGGGTIA